MANHNTQRYHSMREAYQQVYMQEGLGKIAQGALSLAGKAGNMAKKHLSDKRGDDELIGSTSSNKNESVSIMPMGRGPMVVKHTTNIDLELTPEYKGPGEVSKAYYTYPAGFDPTGRQDIVKDQSYNGSEKRSEKKMEEEYVNENRNAAHTAGESEGKKMMRGSGPAKVTGGKTYTMKGKDGKPLFGKNEEREYELSEMDYSPPPKPPAEVRPASAKSGAKNPGVTLGKVARKTTDLVRNRDRRAKYGPSKASSTLGGAAKSAGMGAAGLGAAGALSAAMNKKPKKKYKMEELEYTDLELVCDMLLDEGLVNTPEGAEAFWNHMSDEWRNTLLERCWKGYEPTGKKPYSKGSCKKA